MDRRILITGAASGLGRALAQAAVADGARVLLTDRDQAAGELARLELAESIREAGGDTARVAFLPLDVRDDLAWDAAREWCALQWGGLDVLVNNAGVAAAGPIAEIPMADWDWILEINLKGVIRGVRTFVPMFAAQGSGHVVNIASLAGLMNLANMASYNVTKAGVISLSETMRCELEPLGVRTTVVCPSFFQTNLAARDAHHRPVVRVDGTQGDRGRAVSRPETDRGRRRPQGAACGRPAQVPAAAAHRDPPDVGAEAAGPDPVRQGSGRGQSAGREAIRDEDGRPPEGDRPDSLTRL